MADFCLLSICLRKIFNLGVSGKPGKRIANTPFAFHLRKDSFIYVNS